MGHIHDILKWLHDNPDALNGVDPQEYEWREIADTMGLLGEISKESIDFIGAWPKEMRNTVISLLASQSRGDATVRLSWAPSYDFTLTIAKANFEGDTEYAVQLGSKYPPEVGT
ncbi:MAG: hypothetical protein QOD30_1698 [Actinomycetota bacterium]|jgi:hypothetical protein|nr:hypothetical protein [Actinomycetota bacterium]